MDELSAWKNFTETGRVEDYLRYCEIKLKAGAQGCKTEEKHEIIHERADTEGADYF